MTPVIDNMLPSASGLKIVVTGASGFVGQLLVPRLHAAGAQLLLVGREIHKLKTRFSGHEYCDYSELGTRGTGYDMLIHLAARNNNQPGTLEDFRAINVTFLLETAQAAQQAGIAKFIDVSSIQTVELPEGKSAYTDSKREGTAALSAVEGIKITTLLLPLVHSDDQYAGKLSKLTNLPRIVSKPLLGLLSALKPTLHVDQLLKHILNNSPGGVITTGQSQNRSYAFLSRLMDLGFAFCVIIALFWLVIIAWIAIKLDSSGPGLFVQSRVGRDRKVFPCFKLRTMKTETPNAGTHEVNAAASVTRVGQFLRKSKIDELPQVLNLIRGDMSLVGPRPCLPMQTQLIEERDNCGIFSIRPGITGLAQVQNIDMSDPKRLARTDAAYIARRSILLDVKLVIKTMLGGGIR